MTEPVFLSAELEAFIRSQEAERTELMRQNNALLVGFVAQFEERFPKQSDPKEVVAEKRDWFAGQALSNPALCTGSAAEYELKAWFGDRGGITKHEVAAAQAYQFANAAIRARSK